ncbi:glycosyltransferase family 9 protein [Pelodictyon phaeoclathratiforme]|uniref:Glycosyl transferase family 9 n=1 Tax=Pelodictyon phaeoclathratiforme (strain DSM 5477 / BU-1) TaxID=324925 RepID=B4SCD5_PELPB|nr:glycosyltransferase family 9 protein [Pelodictyon phaeoclathratiforme]ACF42715.1 glycosyl transferase family 9 [Pelodictyon phaeoclathratiforme BU-1]MBV5288488.1 glycosyltransferase family 9 protein [Pelodictyon phaeoclathratiforme]
MKQRKKKKKRVLRQVFARFLQLTAPKRTSGIPFTGKLRSIAILAQEKLGDSVLLTPLLKNLRIQYPKLAIHIITFSQSSFDFFCCDPNVTAVHQVKKNPLNYFKEVLTHRFDLLFNTKDHPSTHFLLQSALIRARYKVGHACEFHEGLFDHLIAIPFHSHMAMKNCALLTLFGSHPPNDQCRPSLPPMPVSDAIVMFLQKIAVKTIIGINLSAGEMNRQWLEKSWEELLQLYSDETFIVLSGPEGREEKQRIETRFSNVLASPSTQNIYEAGLIIATVKLLITPDTSLIHVASCYDIPVIGLYREAPQDLSRFGPLFIPFELIISATGEVSDISVTAVAEKVQLLAKKVE